MKVFPAPMTELCEVVITAPDPDWLKGFSRRLVKQRLCASAHNFAPVRSIYRWRGDIYERTEGRVTCTPGATEWRDRRGGQEGTSLRSSWHLHTDRHRWQSGLPGLDDQETAPD